MAAVVIFYASMGTILALMLSVVAISVRAIGAACILLILAGVCLLIGLVFALFGNFSPEQYEEGADYPHTDPAK